MTNAGVMARCLADTPAAVALARDAQTVVNIGQYLKSLQ